MAESHQYYTAKSKEFRAEQKKLEKQSFHMYLMRLFSFVGFIASIILFVYTEYNYWYLSGAIALLFSFLSIVQWDFRLSRIRKLVANKALIVENELKYLNHQYNEFDGGDEFSAKNPHLAGDFDLFGNGSLYQYLNRCVTRQGSENLANDLSFPCKDAKKIADRQKSISEISEKPDFITNFRANGLIDDNKNDDFEGFSRWLNEPYENIKTLRVISIVYPLIFMAWLILVITGLFPAGSMSIPIVAAFSIIVFYMKKINKAHAKLAKSGEMFKRYATLIKLIENETFESELLAGLQNRLKNGNQKASEVVSSLYKLIDRFDLRSNLVVSIIFNMSFLFDLHIYYQLYRWNRKHSAVVSDWFNVLSEIDALISFSVFAYNNSNEVMYPQISSNEFIFEAVEMGHPLIPVSTRINNDVRFGGNPMVVVVTGANMACKSSFLRTMAVNLIMAMNGAPVCARKFLFKPCDIMSSINIRDSLSQKASYFYAELVRIKAIIDHVSKHPDTIVILDEILRGTNTKDKQAGSLGLLEKLISMNSVVIVATHDLLIGELDKKYPQFVINHCFEVELENDQLVFDYKLKNGISQKLNASFLMKKMGII